MMRAKSSASRNEQMLNEPVSSVIPKMAVPTIISMIITAVYNIADTYFVSQIGTSASGAVGIVFSAMTIVQATAFTIGMGSGNNMARRLGAGDDEEAKNYVSTAWFTGFLIGCVIAGLCFFNLKKMVVLLGATETIAPYAVDYARYIVIATPFMMCSFIMNNLLRFQGLASYAMVGITTGGILNMVFDPIFIYGFGLGTGGAGMATALSQFISFLILLFMCNMKKGAIRIRFSCFKPSLKRYTSIFYTGAPSLVRQGLMGVSTVVLNRIAGPYGDAAIAAMAIVTKCTMLINSVVVGFGQGFQPVCSFSYGAKKYSRVREAFWFCVKVSTVILIVFGGVEMVFAKQLIMLFRRDDAEVIRIGTFALRAQLCVLPIWGFYTMSNMLSQSIGYGLRATIIACARQGLILIPMLMILPRLFGLTGLVLAQPAADVIAALVAAGFMFGILRELKQREDSMQ